MALNRKTWIWRIDRDDEQEKINAFLDAQSNIAESMKTLVIYAQSRFGNKNITLSDIREILSKEVLLSKQGKPLDNTEYNVIGNTDDNQNKNQSQNYIKKNTSNNTTDNTEQIDYSKVDVKKLL